MNYTNKFQSTFSQYLYFMKCALTAKLFAGLLETPPPLPKRKTNILPILLRHTQFSYPRANILTNAPLDPTNFLTPPCKFSHKCSWTHQIFLPPLAKILTRGAWTHQKFLPQNQIFFPCLEHDGLPCNGRQAANFLTDAPCVTSWCESHCSES